MNDLYSIGFESLFDDIIEPANEASDAVVIAGMLILSSILLLPAALFSAKERKVEREKQAKEKANKAEYNKNKEEYEDTHDIDKIIKDVKTDIKKMVSEANRNSKIQERIKKSLQEDDIKPYKVKFIFNDTEDYEYIIIINEDQLVNSALSWFIDDMAEVLSVKYKDAIFYGMLTIDTGDGDEGCIYLNY